MAKAATARTARRGRRASSYAWYDPRGWGELVLSIPIGAALSWIWREVLADQALISRFLTPPVLVTLTFALAIAILIAPRLKPKQQATRLSWLTQVAGMTLLFNIFWDWFYWEHLNSEWFRDMTFVTGKTAISFLFLSLACTPLITLFNWKALNQLRKPLGNYGFLFVAVHLGIFTFDYAWLETTIQLDLAAEEAVRKGYALVGFLAFLLLVPLFATSTKWAMKKLGRNWKRLHRLVYLVNVLAVTHYIWVWSSKRALTQPVIFAILLAFMLFLRLDSVKKQAVKLRRAISL